MLKNPKETFLKYQVLCANCNWIKRYENQEEFNYLEQYSKAGETSVIKGSKEKSYCLDGLNRNTVVFRTKVNHIMIRGCDDTKIYLNGGTISGIDVLKGSNISVTTPKHNFTNVEISNYTQLKGLLDKNTLIYIINSIDVFVNQKNIGVNPFNQLKLVYKKYDYQERINIGNIPIKLFVRGQTIDYC